jgi:hypothetical protein
MDLISILSVLICFFLNLHLLSGVAGTRTRFPALWVWRALALSTNIPRKLMPLACYVAVIAVSGRSGQVR